MDSGGEKKERGEANESQSVPKSETSPRRPRAAATNKKKSAERDVKRDSITTERHIDTPQSDQGWVAQWLNDSPSWLSSLVLHTLVLLLLAIWVMPSAREPAKAGLRFSTEEVTDDLPEELIEPEDEMPDVEIDQIEESIQPDAEIVEVEPELSELDAMEAASIEMVDFGTEFSPENLLNDSDGGISTALAGRGQAERGALVRRGGGTKGSEEAVTRALKWLARHQFADGGWSFDHGRQKCNGRCRNPGTMVDARNGATALALLPFLGAGQTHLEGEYRTVVERGLGFLVSRMKVSTVKVKADGADTKLVVGSLYEDRGTMYSHGLAAIALCESYAMTRDSSLASPAQLALNYIDFAQDPNGGGWRYRPHDPGDTSAVGWQIMALKSGHMGSLVVRPITVKKASYFLDSVQSDEGASYRYTQVIEGDPNSRRIYTTGRRAIGLLCRMYLGWKKGHPALNAGVERIGKTGPSSTNFYTNYYATQVMFQYTGAEGPMWEKWNKKMRDQLVTTQATKDHELGSWMAGKSHVSLSGGRLYCTALGAMILEVYYRHMPIYREQATTEEFPE